MTRTRLATVVLVVAGCGARVRDSGAPAIPTQGFPHTWAEREAAANAPVPAATEPTEPAEPGEPADAAAEPTPPPRGPSAADPPNTDTSAPAGPPRR